MTVAALLLLSVLRPTSKTALLVLSLPAPRWPRRGSCDWKVSFTGNFRASRARKKRAARSDAEQEGAAEQRPYG